MNWKPVKDFLRPDWRKIVITIVLFFILGFLSFFTASCTEAYGSMECFQSGACGWRCCYSLPIPTCGMSGIKIFLILLVESYILSFLIIHALDRLRSGKK